MLPQDYSLIIFFSSFPVYKVGVFWQYFPVRSNFFWSLIFSRIVCHRSHNVPWSPVHIYSLLFYSHSSRLFSQPATPLYSSLYIFLDHSVYLCNSNIWPRWPWTNRKEILYKKSISEKLFWISKRIFATGNSRPQAFTAHGLSLHSLKFYLVT